ncbi:MAG TPA: ABC transporter ATP-binding protein [Dehalococcoidales bacterium]|nr:ABC transporter ATP-binding protein [Dehalococcoidales bacterium]
MRILEGEGVTRYFGGLAAVADVSFHVERGEVAGLIGPNGAGKTTLFNLISASLAPNSGTIKFKGVNITGRKPHQICHMGVARTFQTVKIFANMPVIDNVRLGAFFGTSSGMSAAEASREAAELLEFVGLQAVSAIPARDLTLANQKKLEVARALATKPELLLLDELMAGLNQTEVAQAMQMIRQIHDRGITIVMIEHVMTAIMKACDRIIVLHHGKKIAEGTPQEIASSETVINVYLGEQSYAGG